MLEISVLKVKNNLSEIKVAKELRGPFGYKSGTYMTRHLDSRYYE